MSSMTYARRAIHASGADPDAAIDALFADLNAVVATGWAVSGVIDVIDKDGGHEASVTVEKAVEVP